MTTTLSEVIERFNVDVLDHLDRQVDVPVVAGMQRQGDLLIIPQTPGIAVGKSVPSDGVPVVRGENGGNTHLLLADGPVTWRQIEGQSQSIGVMTVPKGAVAYLAHPEHGYMGFAPGEYVIRRQREMADEIRLVAD